MRQLVHGGDIYSKNNIENLIDFSANINPLGMPKSVKDAIIDNIDNYCNYPDPLCRELRMAISEYEGTSINNIVCGNGAADIIFRIALGLKPKNTLMLAPTFSEYEDAIKLVHSKVNYYYLKEENNFNIDKDILEKINEDLDMIFICNPNNPTGIPKIKEEMLEILIRCKEKNVTLVVDECFIDFLENEERYSISNYIDEFDNLIILKAFTKMYAMAGIRLGYMLSSNKGYINKISGIGQPWSVSTVASKCGIAALKEKDFVLETKKYIKENREFLIKELRDLNFKVYESKANYILFKSKDSNIKDKLEKEGILIRPCGNYVNLSGEFFRIAVRKREENQIFLRSIKKIME